MTWTPPSRRHIQDHCLIRRRRLLRQFSSQQQQYQLDQHQRRYKSPHRAINSTRLYNDNHRRSNRGNHSSCHSRSIALQEETLAPVKQKQPTPLFLLSICNLASHSRVKRKIFFHLETRWSSLQRYQRSCRSNQSPKTRKEHLSPSSCSDVCVATFFRTF